MEQKNDIDYKALIATINNAALDLSQQTFTPTDKDHEYEISGYEGEKFNQIAIVSGAKEVTMLCSKKNFDNIVKATGGQVMQSPGFQMLGMSEFTSNEKDLNAVPKFLDTLKKAGLLDIQTSADFLKDTEYYVSAMAYLGKNNHKMHYSIVLGHQ